MSDPKILTGGAPSSGSDQEKADIAAHADWSQKLAEDLVAALNKHTKEHGSDIIANTTPLTPKEKAELAAMLEADKWC
jgi:hypothetical protein